MGTCLGYRALDELVAPWAKSLLSAGVARGNRVASLAPPSIEWLAVMLATTEIGAASVSLRRIAHYRPPARTGD